MVEVNGIMYVNKQAALDANGVSRSRVNWYISKYPGTSYEGAICAVKNTPIIAQQAGARGGHYSAKKIKLDPQKYGFHSELHRQQTDSCRQPGRCPAD